MKNENVIILKSDKELNEIASLLKEDYSCLNDRISNCNIKTEEKKFNHRWEEIDKDFNIQNLHVGTEDVRVIQAYAIIETNKFSGSDRIRISENIPLPKSERVIENKSLVLFLEYLKSTYIIVNGPKTVESKIRTLLMEQKRGTESRWGKIYNKNIGIYAFDKSFYRWVLKQRGKILREPNYSLELNDLRGFKSGTSRNANTFSGEGSNIDNEIPFKSVVSLDENISSLHIELKVNNRTSYSFELDNDGRLKVVTTLCGEFLVQNPKIYSNKEIFLNIYFEIIPFLVKKFNESKNNNWDYEEKQLIEAYSKDIITQISKNITIQNSIAEENIQ